MTAQQPEPNELHTVAEVALHLRVSERFVVDEIRRKRLRAAKLANAWRITTADRDTYLEAHMNVARVARKTA